jgi:peptidoglycan biosynthesis protein MviN/MurJ (putative lipid II flippase)
LLVYALAIPIALLNQIWIRVWNRGAAVGDMLRLAVILLSINIVGNFVLVGAFGAVGIAISTVVVQLVQCLYLGWKWDETARAVALVSSTVVIGLLVGGISGA